ncbi:type IV pilus assembly protein PilM [Microbacterium kribbense]|uniref:Type IV pilus assembly protein PilM n=1 Tax=Microbacterium kribbense TaxID=433645 RepID=A0ABP7GVC2_9MICO
MAKTMVGVEITEESVRAVEITRGRMPRIIAAGEVALPPDIAKDSEAIDQNSVALALTHLWSRAGIKGRSVTLGVGSRRILVREHSSQAMPPQLLKQALPFQVQDLLPVPVDQAVLDFYPLAEGDGMVHGLLVAAVSETIEDLISTLAKARLQVDAVDFTPFGLARVAKVLAAPGEVIAMVHIGDHTTHVVVVVDGIPQFVRIIPADIHTAAVRARMHVAVDAEAVLETVPPDPLQFQGRAALRAANAPEMLIDELTARVRNTLAFYANRPGSIPVSVVRVSGAGAAVPGLLDVLGRALEVRIAPVTAEDAVGGRSIPLESADLALNLVGTAGIVLEGGY